MEAGLRETIAGFVNIAADFADLFSIFCRLSRDVVTNIIMIMRCLWQRRNKKVWHDEVKEPHVSIHTTKKTKISEGYLVRENVKSLSNSVTNFCDQGICEEFHFFRH